MRGKNAKKLFKALVCICLLLFLGAFFSQRAQAISGGTVGAQYLSTRLEINPPVVTSNPPVNASFTVYTSGSNLRLAGGNVTITLYCDLPAYAQIVGPGAPIYQYPGLPVDLTKGYIKKVTASTTSASAYNFSNACTYSGRGLTYQPLVVVEHQGVAAWNSTSITILSVIQPYPSPSKTSATPTPLTNYSVRMFRANNDSAVVPFTDSLGASITIPSPNNPSVWTDYISGGPFGYSLCCDKNANGSCNIATPLVWRGGSPYPFGNVCTYNKAGVYTREVRATSYSNLDQPTGYKYATDRITITDPVTNLSANLTANPSQPTDAQNTTLTATTTTNNVTNTINYSFWWHCASTATNFLNAKAECGDPTNATIGAKFDGVSASTISKSVLHKYGAGTYHPKVIIEQGNASATKAFDLTIRNNPTIVPAIQAISNNIISGNTRQYQLKASQSGYRVQSDQNYYIWYNCNLGLDSVQDSLSLCGASDPAQYHSFLNSTLNAVTYNHNYAPGTYRPKVVVRRDSLEKAAYTDLVVPPIALASPSPSPSPSLTATSFTASLQAAKSADGLGVTFGSSLLPAATGTIPDTNFTFWWNCNSDKTAYKELVTECGAPEVIGQSSTSAMKAAGRRFEAIHANDKTVSRNFSSSFSSQTALALIERGGSSAIAKTSYGFTLPSATPIASPSPSPSVSAPAGQMTLALDVTPEIKIDNETVTMTADVTDTNSAVASTNYTFWWHCDNPSTNVQEVMNDPNCGAPKINGDATTDTPERRANGIQFNAIKLDGGLANQKIATKLFTSGPRTIKVIVERRSQSIETRKAIVVNPQTLDVDLNISPAQASTGQAVTLNAITQSSDQASKYSYYFWWDCNNPTTSLTEASQAANCGPPVDRANGIQFENLATTISSKSVNRSYNTGGTKHPKVLVVHGNLATSRVGEIEVIQPTLAAGLSINPTSAEGEAKPATLTASAGGSAQGTVNYTYWWDCDNPSTNIDEVSNACGSPLDTEIGSKNDSIDSNTHSQTHDYAGANVYHPKVIIERDGANPSEARTELTITEPIEKTLYLSLSARRVGDGFPVNMAFTTEISGSASGSTEYKIWWDCQPSNVDLDTLMSECGDPGDSQNGSVFTTLATETTKTINHEYELAGFRHPVALATREGISDVKLAEIEIPENDDFEPNEEPSEEPSLEPSEEPSVEPSEEPLPSVSPSVTPESSTLEFSAGFSVKGFNTDQTTDPYTNKGITVYLLNQVARAWDKVGPGDEVRTLEANKAFYFFSPIDTNVEISAGETNSSIIVTPGWNFVWNETQANLNSYKVNVYDSGQCLAKDVPIGVLRAASVAYRWIYVVEDDQSLISCQVFSLLTGKDKPSTGCNESNPLLNEVASIRSGKGVWIYLFQNKLDGWTDRNQFSCN